MKGLSYLVLAPDLLVGFVFNNDSLHPGTTIEVSDIYNN